MENYICVKNGYSSSANQISTNGEIEVDCVSLDNDISEKITTIKMDIEGARKKHLKVARII